ncbi:DNA replication protein [Fructobacillus fructosus]|uniref:DNA replication protein n=1 Tax=Fructobacillus fructosus TaxID=1631 RepID=UPI001FD36302|nr:DNA replication protein [Fructobacillus fructosus]
MAQRRMFSKKITDTDIFLDMPLSAQALYFHLNMHADDDGFISNAKTIQRMVGSSEDDMKLLVAKKFILPFDSGVQVIVHWRVHNYIRKDTYNRTIYRTEQEQLTINENGQYIKENNIPSTERIRVVDDSSPQVRLGKDIDNNVQQVEPSIPKKSKSTKLSKQEKTDFEALWKLYPRKQGKQQAEKAYLKAIRDGVTNKSIQDGIVAYSKKISAEQTEFNFIKMGSTFFNSRSWEDDFTISVPTNSKGKPVKQEPPMAKNEVPASSEKVDMQAVKGMLKGIKTSG